MTLYEIIKALQAAQGSKAKQAILVSNSGNELLKAYMQAVYDPSLSYYQTALPKCVGTDGFGEFDEGVLLILKANLAGRMTTGSEAKRFLVNLLAVLNAEAKELVALIIKRSIGGSVGETMVLKTWPGLFFVPKYMRCAGMSAKVKVEYAALPFFYAQTKYDGSFGYLQSGHEGDSLFTRAGNYYPSNLALRLARDIPAGYVVMGELLVFENGEPLSRKVGNGVLNSILQSGEFSTDQDVRMIAWDVVTLTEFQDGKSNTPYVSRLNTLTWCAGSASLSVAPTARVTSLEAAFALNREALLRGEEGTVWKKPEGIWRDSSSGTRDAVKVKIKFEAEYVVTGKYEGEGKAKGMLGGFNVATSCGKIANNVGSGFSDAQRKEYWEADTDGWIVTLEANDVIDKTGSATESLFLPIFVERRLDKTEADSRERVMEQLQAAKEGV